MKKLLSFLQVSPPPGDNLHHKRNFAISQLMNITLQCLGAIRLLSLEENRDHTAMACSSLNISNDEIIAVDKKTHLQRFVFCKAVETLSQMISSSETDSSTTNGSSIASPMLALVESFPCFSMLQAPTWLILHWAILTTANSLNIAEESAISGTDPGENSHQRIMDSHCHVVRSVLRYFPDSLLEIDSSGHTYLYPVVESQSIPLLEEVLRYHPSCVDVADCRGRKPIHYAAEVSQSIESLMVIAEAMHVSLTTSLAAYVDDYGNLPLHWAAQGSSSKEVLQEILFCCPDSVKYANHSGLLPLHCAAAKQCHLTAVKNIFSLYPDAISIPDKSGMLPLHHACLHCQSIEIVQFLHENYPAAVVTPIARCGRLPLHYAAVHCRSADIISYLLKHNPSGAEATDGNNRTPLHNLIARCDYMTPTRLQCLKLLLQYGPRGASIQDRKEESPLDLAHRESLGDAVIQLLQGS